MGKQIPEKSKRKTEKLTERELKEKVLRVLEEQGFEVHSRLKPAGTGFSNEVYRQLQRQAKLKQLSFHKEFLRKFFHVAKKYCRNGKDVDPTQISLELREVKKGSPEEILFRWWNLVWWSIPYQPSYGRRMRFLIWDVA